MRAIVLCVMAAILLALGIPEVWRFRSERELYRAIGLAELLGSGRAVPSRGAIVERVESLTRSAARGLPGDPRPGMAKGSALLVAGHASEARSAFLEVLLEGERGDALVGLGLSELLSGREPFAREAFLRAAWVSPSLIPRIPESERNFVQGEISARERLMRAGQPVPVPAAPALH